MQTIFLYHIAYIFLQKMVAVSLATKMHTMKILVLQSVCNNLGVAIDFLKCFPFFEKLYVIVGVYSCCSKLQINHCPLGQSYDK